MKSAGAAIGLALCVISCSGSGGGGTPAPSQAPRIASTSTSPALADWQPGQELTLSWTLGGGAPVNLVVRNSGLVPLGWNQAAQGGAPPTSYRFTPTWAEVQEPWELAVFNGLGAATAAWSIPTAGFRPSTTVLADGVATVRVDGEVAAAAQGTVVFYHEVDGVWSFTARAALADGTAHAPVPPAGARSVFATYSGDCLRAGSASNSVSIP